MKLLTSIVRLSQLVGAAIVISRAAVVSERLSRLKSLPRIGLLIMACFVISFGYSPSAKAEGFTDLFTTKLGCYDRASFGVGMLNSYSGSLTVSSPGLVVEAYIEWAYIYGSQQVQSSALTINGAYVPGIQPAGVAGYDVVGNPANGGFVSHTWYANIGPTGSGLISATPGSTTLDITGVALGATVTLIYDTTPCTQLNQIQQKTGIDYSYKDRWLDNASELLIFDVPNIDEDRLATMVFAHGGTHQYYDNYNGCRGRAIWMKAGSGAKPDPYSVELFRPAGEITAWNTPGIGINGGVEILNDPFAGGNPACTIRINPAPDYPYLAGHPYPNGAAGGANSSPYYAVSVTPPEGGDDGPEWGVIDVVVNIPKNSDWIAFQLESEPDAWGESGVWGGSAGLMIHELVPQNGSLRVNKNLSGLPGGEPSPWFTIDVTCDAGGINQTFSLQGGQNRLIEDIPGDARCTVNERNIPDVAGYRWDPLTYSPAQTVTIVANQTVAVTVNNTLLQDNASLEIKKNLNGVVLFHNPDYDINVSCTNGVNQDISIKRDETETIGNIPVGTECTVTEGDLPNPPWLREYTAPTYSPAQTITIQPISGGGTTQSANLAINSDDPTQPALVIPLTGQLAANNPNVVTVMNALITSRKASITIAKNALPDSSERFYYSAVGVNPSSFNLRDNGQQLNQNYKRFNNLGPDIYTFTESAKSGWVLDSIVCQGSVDTQYTIDYDIVGGVQVGGSVEIDLGVDENITCTFNNVALCPDPTTEFPNIVTVGSDSEEINLDNNKDQVCVRVGEGGSIEVSKVVSGYPGFYDKEFELKLDCSGGSEPPLNLPIKGGQSVTIDRIVSGSECTVTEPDFPEPPDGYVFLPESYTPSATVPVFEGETASITVGNTLEKVVVDVGIVKTVSEDDALPGQTYSYVLTATNHSSTQLATEVYAIDPLETQLTHVCNSSSTSPIPAEPADVRAQCLALVRNTTEYDINTGKWTIGDLGPGEVVSLTIVVRVN